MAHSGTCFACDIAGIAGHLYMAETVQENSSSCKGSADERGLRDEG